MSGASNDVDADDGRENESESSVGRHNAGLLAMGEE